MKNKLFHFNLVTRLENVNTSDKETQIDHVAMLTEFDLIRYQQQHPDVYRPYGRRILFHIKKFILFFFLY